MNARDVGLYHLLKAYSDVLLRSERPIAADETVTNCRMGKDK